jgi:hypothetical protein
LRLFRQVQFINGHPLSMPPEAIGESAHWYVHQKTPSIYR